MKSHFLFPSCSVLLDMKKGNLFRGHGWKDFANIFEYTFCVSLKDAVIQKSDETDFSGVYTRLESCDLSAFLFPWNL